MERQTIAPARMEDLVPISLRDAASRIGSSFKASAVAEPGPFTARLTGRKTNPANAGRPRVGIAIQAGGPRGWENRAGVAP